MTTETFKPAYELVTNLKTLKKVWNILKDHELSGLLNGEEIPVDKLLTAFLETDALTVFIKTITKGLENVDIEELELGYIRVIVTDFFGNIQGVAGELKSS